MHIMTGVRTRDMALDNALNCSSLVDGILRCLLGARDTDFDVNARAGAMGMRRRAGFPEVAMSRSVDCRKRWPTNALQTLKSKRLAWRWNCPSLIRDDLANG